MLQKKAQLTAVMQKTNILCNEPRLNPWLARVLIAELLWGKGSLQSECKPVQTILRYEKELWDELRAIDQQLEQIPSQNKDIVKKPRYVRVNTLILDVATAISSFEEEGWIFIPQCTNYSSYLRTLRNLKEPYFTQDCHIPELFAFPSKVTFYNHDGYLTGQLALQDKASCLPAHLLNPPPGSVVLDMCAAPGMKTTHLAAIMQNDGKIYATEIDRERYGTLCNFVEKMNCTCVHPMNLDAMTLRNEDFPNIEYILVDPSCSGSGMSDRQLLEESFTAERLGRLRSFQVFLLRYALLNFPAVKRVVYSTCSINEDENEKVVDEILGNVGDAYRLVPAKELFGENWINYSSKSFDCSDNCFYARSDKDLTNGFFVAVFERNIDVPLPEYKRKRKKLDQVEETREIEEQFQEEKMPPTKRKKRGKRHHKVKAD